MAQRQKLGGDKNAVDDLVMIDKLHEDTVMTNLKNRYAADAIYTNIGPVLVAINPFKMIPRLYTEAKIREYKGKKYYEMAPHVYALADDAYRKMINYRENQCIIISGESGSGKTETSKLIMQYISSVSGRSIEVQRVKDRMLSSNPLLEAFGNAKTVNNNNSSRFGKYMEILFDYGGDPQAGRVTNYLLEKSRVVGPAVGERNFHVFYQLCAGANDQEREQFCIYGPEYFWYLSQSECYQVDGIDDVKDFREMTAAMHTLGMSDADKAEVFRVVSSVLWLGNLTFAEDNQENSRVEDHQVLGIVAALLQVDAQGLQKALCFREIQTGTGQRLETFVKPLPAKQAAFSRDTLAKALYSRMFDYLVLRINESIKTKEFKGIMIGVLDIYGFEIFQFNSFEQLCINFVNERLQQIFIELTLKAEQDEYRAEGIPWQEIEYYNNKPICDLIEGSPGLLSICDDCCHTAKTDQMFVQDLKSFFGGNPAIFCGSNDFSIRHYAGDVRYESENFLTKNKDTLFDDLILLIQTSPCLFNKSHGWADLVVSTGQKKRPPTVGFTFKQQVGALMSALKACEPHYIRCIKPNMKKVPNDFDTANIRRQVQYLGLMENIRVRRLGYAYRAPFPVFVKRYKLLSKQMLSGRARGDDRQLSEVILSDIGYRNGQEYAVGKSKVFIRAAASLFQLEELIERKYNEAVIIIQKAYRKYKQRRYYLEMRAKAYDVVVNRKERRRNSISTEYRGDYLNFTYNNLVNGLLQVVGKREKVIFADRSKVVLLRGKKGLFEKIASAFSKPEDLVDTRFCLLSDEALYSFVFIQEPETNQTKAKLFFRVPIHQIMGITLSPFADNFMVVHFNPAAQTTDVVHTLRHKTELAGLLVHNYKLKTGVPLNVTFAVNDSVSLGENKVVAITWVKDELVPAGQEKLVPIKHNIEIHVPSGIPSSQVPAPFRPAEIDLSVPARPSLRALYDYKGNGIDELTFKKDDIIFIVAEEDAGWYSGELNGAKGFVPANHVERVARANKPQPKPAQPRPPQPAQTMVSKCDWQELKSEEGQIYYWNSTSGESVWEKPAELVAFERNQQKPRVASVSQGKGCAFSGCGNQRFAGKAYCVSHIKMAQADAAPAPSPAPAAAVKQPVAQPAYHAQPSPSASPATQAKMAMPGMGGAAARPMGMGMPQAVQPQQQARPAVQMPARPAIPVAQPMAAGGVKPPAPMGAPPQRTGFGVPAQVRVTPAATPAPAAAAGGGMAQSRPAGAAMGGFAMPGMGGAAAAQARPAVNMPAARPQAQAQPQAAAGAPAMPARPQFQMPAAAARPGVVKPPAPSGPPPPKQSDWVACVDPSSQATYYYNNVTGASQWDKPAGFFG